MPWSARGALALAQEVGAGMSGVRLLSMGVVALAIAGSSAAPALAAPAADTSPPRVVVEPLAHFVVGGVLETGYDNEADVVSGLAEYWNTDLALRWRTSDPSGICRQSVTEKSYDTDGGGTDPVLGDSTSRYGVGARTRSLVFRTQEPDEARVTSRFVVRARDCAGNTGTSDVATVSVGFVEDLSPKVTYRGSWRTARFGGFSGGTTHTTSAAGARADVTVPGGPVALVMEKAADRGVADVLVDGVRRATVDTHSSTTQHRSIVWQAVLPAGEHTVTVVNRATPGHPRIDLDLVLTR